MKNTDLLGNLKRAGMDMSILKERRVGEMQDNSCEKLIFIIKIIRK